MEAAWPSLSVDQEQQPSRLAPGHRLLKYMMGIVLSQARCEQMRQHQCVVKTLNTMCVAILAVFNASNIGNDLTRALKGGKQLHSLRHVDVERPVADSASSSPAPETRTSLVYTARSSRRSGAATGVFPTPVAPPQQMRAETEQHHRFGHYNREDNVQDDNSPCGRRSSCDLEEATRDSPA